MLDTYSSPLIPVLLVLCLALMASSLRQGCDVHYIATHARYIANCSSGGIHHIPYDLHHDIKVMDLQNNQLQTLIPNAFAKYDGLTELYLQNNSLRNIKPNAFLQLQQLRVLDLSINHLTSISNHTFNGLSSLRLLSLRGNKIAHIPNGAFQELVNLRSLYLDGNYVEVIEPMAFQRLDYLELLDLTKNNLRSMDKSVVEFFSQRLQTFKIYNNPWDCDCNIRWLQKYLLDFLPNANYTPGDPLLKWRFLEGQPICNNPPELKDRAFYDLSVEDFVCKIIMYSSGQRIITEIGQQVNLFCKYDSTPAVYPVWTKSTGDRSMDIPSDSQKYVITNEHGNWIISKLTISNFQMSDIAEYSCQVENARGLKSISYQVTLEGIDPAQYTMPVVQASGKPQNTHTLVIVLSVVGGFILVLFVMGLTMYMVLKCRRRRKKLNQQLSMKFKEHIKTNVLNQSDITGGGEVDKHDVSMHSEMENGDPLYDKVKADHEGQTGTYVSFKGDFVEQEELQQLYTGVTNNSQTPNHRGNASDGSQSESTSPLLEEFSPIMCNSHDLLYETNTSSSVYTPALLPRAHTLNCRHLPSVSSYDTYQEYTPYSTLSHHGHSPHRISTPIGGQFYTKSVSTGYIGPVPPKKPPRVSHSRDSMNLSQTSSSGDEGGQLKLSLPKPGTVDEFGTAV